MVWFWKESKLSFVNKSLEKYIFRGLHQVFFFNFPTNSCTSSTKDFPKSVSKNSSKISLYFFFRGYIWNFAGIAPYILLEFFQKFLFWRWLWKLLQGFFQKFTRIPFKISSEIAPVAQLIFIACMKEQVISRNSHE